MLRKLKNFLKRARGIWPLRRRWKAVLSTEEPEALQPNVVYVVGEQEKWVAMFICPCGCQKTVCLNLLNGHRPRWSISLSAKDIPTISPSINRKVGCRSHFFLKSGRIVWCGRRHRQ